MRWPPWRKKSTQDRDTARETLARVEAQWVDVHEAVAPLREGMVRNHLIERAFAIRERGDR